MRGKLLFLLLLLFPMGVCLAHPMGNFSVNHYTKLTFEPDGIHLQYYMDLAEIPTYQELQQYNLTPEDKAALPGFTRARGLELMRGLSLRINNVAVPLTLVSDAVIFPPGAGGLPTMKLGYVFHADYPAGAGKASDTLAYADNNFPGHAGWKEIVVDGPRASILASSASSVDRSDGLSNYPTNLLNSAPQDLQATVSFVPPAPAIAPPTATAAVAASPVRAPAHPSKHAIATALPQHVRAANAVAIPTARPAVSSVISPAPIARVVPAAPAPMHLTANRQGTSRSAFTQLITTRHMSLWFLLTAAFISMGLGALHALEPGHGKTIVAAYLVGSRGTARHAMLLGIIVTTAHTASVFALGAVTLYAAHYILPEQLYPWLSALSGLTIAILGGYLLLRRWTGLEIEHTHAVGEMHSHWAFFKRRESAGTPALSVPEAELAGAASPRQDGPISLLQLFSLGITGGIIPCPAALVVLLSAFALHRVGFGFFLITAFSAGLAAVLIGFGLLMVYARRFMSRLITDGPLTRRWLPIVSACFIMTLGIVLAVRGFSTTTLAAHFLPHANLGPALFVAGLGLVLGIRHSTDPDHVVAISTIVSRQRSIRGAAVIGLLWGLGHTLTIFAVGCLIILFGVVIPPRVGLSMEFSVALMLILLGVLNLTGTMQRIVARITPRSATPAQAPTTTIERANPKRRVISRYGLYQYGRPLAVGLVHGLAGSAAVALLVLSTIHNPFWAILYLVIFGGGTLLGMMCMTAAMSLPLVYAGDKLPRISHFFTVASGVVSVCFGSFLVYQLGFLGGLFTSHPHWTPQ